jgi:hypothetical protein
MNILSLIKLREIIWAKYAACMWPLKNLAKFLTRKCERKSPPGTFRVDKMIILKCILRKYDFLFCIGFMMFRMRTG